jgi:hypothetical protein
LTAAAFLPLKKMVFGAPLTLPGVIIAAHEQPPEYVVQQFTVASWPKICKITQKRP